MAPEARRVGRAVTAEDKVMELIVALDTAHSALFPMVAA